MKSFKEYVLSENVKASSNNIGKFEKLAKDNDIDGLLKEIKNIEKQYPNNKDIIKAVVRLKKELPVASVVTENEEELKRGLINAAHNLDEAIKRVRLTHDESSSGVDIENAQHACREILKSLVTKIGTNTKFLIPATEFLIISSKHKTPDKTLSFEELKNSSVSALKNGFNTSAGTITPKDFQNPHFKLSLVVCLGILLLKKLAQSKEFTIEGISKDSEYSEFAVLNEVSKKVNSINIDNKLKNSIGADDIDNSDTFIPAIEKFVDKIYKEASRNETETSFTKPKDENSNVENKTLPKEIASDNSSDSSDSSKDNPSDNLENTENNSSPKGAWNPVAALTIKSSNEEVKKAIDEYFGSEDGNNKGKVYDKILQRMIDSQKENDELYKSSLHKNEEQKASSIVTEGILKQKIKNATPSFGRINISAQKTENSWKEYKDDLEHLAVSYRNKANAIAEKMGGIISIAKKGDYLVKLKKLSHDYESTMFDVFAKAKKVNSYNELGKIGHDLRNDLHAGAEKVKEMRANSKAGQVKAATEENLNEKISNITVKELNKIPEGYRDVFAYAMLNQSNPLTFQEKDVGSETNETVIKAVLSGLSKEYETFGVGSEKEAVMFMKQLFDSKFQNDSAIKEWLKKYNHNYMEQKNVKSLTEPIMNVKKSWNIIQQDLSKSANPIETIKNILGAEDLAKEKIKNASKEPLEEPGEQSNNVAVSVKTEGKILTFKDYYMLNEGVFNNKNILDNDKKKAYALLCLMSIYAGTNNQGVISLEDKALSILSTRDVSKDVISNGVKTYIKDNGEKIAKYINAFNTLANKQPATTPTTTPTTTPVAAQNSNSNEQGGKPIKIGNNGITLQNNSVPEMSVTTGAVGDFTIPDRLTKQLMRRRIKSFM